MSDIIGPVTQSMLEKLLRPAGAGMFITPSDQKVKGKAAAVKATVRDALSGENPAVKRLYERAVLAQQIHDLSDSGISQIEVSKQVAADITVVNVLMRWADAPPIVWSTEDELQKQVVKARDVDDTSWAGIAIKAGTSKGHVQKLYRDAGKDPSTSDIGKGGRRKETYHTPKPKVETPVKAPAKPKVAAKAPAKAPAKAAVKPKAPAKSKATVAKAPAKPKVAPKSATTSSRSAAAKKAAGTGRTVKPKPAPKAEVNTEDTPF